ncbi:MAG TPA: glycosyltransferase family 39 protein [bacterium]|nr:glycosyltransferase family 39 protein [bacterium]
MTPFTSSNRPAPLFWLGVVVLAALGQVFLAQSQRPWTLIPGLLLYALSLYFLFRSNLKKAPVPPKPLSPQAEWILFGAILLIAFALRIYDLDSIPSGMHTDQGLEGQSAQRIAFEGWRPFFEVFNYHVPEIVMYYQLALWFKCFGSSYQTFHVFFALFALAAFPFIYFVFRQWAGPRVALLALFFLAVMRWHLIFSRNGFPTIQVPFYLFVTLYFWIKWTQNRKIAPLLASAVFCGLGLYTYQSFKAVPFLMLAFSFYEYSRSGRKPGVRRAILVFFLLVTILVTPLLYYMTLQGSVGNRERELFIGKTVVEEQSLVPLLRVWAGTALMFNREGESNARHNIPGHRMLDDVSAVFFILGLGLAWRNRKEPQAFYPLVGLGVMSLTCLLTVDPAHANRLLVLTPFIALFCAQALWAFADGISVKDKWLSRLALGVLLGAAAVQNAYAYFIEEAQNHDCWLAYGVEQNYIGRDIEDLEKAQPGRFNYFLASCYFGNHTIAYLSYPARDRVFDLEAQKLEGANPFPSDMDAVFFLEQGRMGLLDLLKLEFPHGQDQVLRDWDGRTLVYIYQVPASDLRAFHGWNHGLKGTYFQSSQWTAKPSAIRWDPVLNFTYKGDFPFTDYPPFRIRWTGSLNVPQTGGYQFQVLTSDSGQLWLDGKPVSLEKPLRLTVGAHKLRLDFEKDGGDEMVLHLVWKKPGEEKWEVVPASAFGKIPRGAKLPAPLPQG